MAIIDEVSALFKSAREQTQVSEVHQYNFFRLMRDDGQEIELEILDAGSFLSSDLRYSAKARSKGNNWIAGNPERSVRLALENLLVHWQRVLHP